MMWRRGHFSPVRSVDMRYRDGDWPLRAAPERCWSGVWSPGPRWWLWDMFVCCDDLWNIKYSLLTGLASRINPIKPDKVWQTLVGWLVLAVPALTPSGVVPVQEPPRGTSSRNFPAFLLGPRIHLVIAVRSKYISVSVSAISRNAQTKTKDQTNLSKTLLFRLPCFLILLGRVSKWVRIISPVFNLKPRLVWNDSSILIWYL